MRTFRWSVPAALALAALAAGQAAAHVQRLAIGGSTVTLKTDSTPDKRKLVFKSVRQPLITVNHDPSATGAAVLVHGTGPNAGKSGLIALHPSNWTTTAQGYVYKDPDGYFGGIKRIVFKTGNNGGSLKIIAKGANFPWVVSGPLNELWVQFKIENEWWCAQFPGATAIRNEAGFFRAKDAPTATACPEVCGNGVLEGTEECDDGDFDDLDGCTATCLTAPCTGETFDSTWEAIQSRILDDAGCAVGFCHGGGAPAGNLNLEPANAYANIVNQLSSISTFDRVEPGDQDLSFLYLKLAAKTIPDQYPPMGIPGSPMPAAGNAISEDHLEALKLWIRAGAPETGTVEDTEALLASCLPPTTPNKIPPLDPPATSDGIQLYAPPWDLPSNSEDEICYATYFDYSSVIPPSAQTPCPSWLSNPLTSTCFRYHETSYGQDPQSHHSIIHIYKGAYNTTNSGWGTWTCKGGPNAGMACNPTGIGIPAPTGADCGDPRSACAGSVVTSVACIGYGPPDYGFNNNNAPSFGGAQEALSGLEYADGVYNVLPVKGIVVWNHHAFNLTNFDTTMEQYYNLYFAAPADQLYQLQGVFDSTEIFTQYVPPFESEEYCRSYTFPQNANLFQFSSHTHEFGKLFRIWAPPNDPSCTAGGGCLPNVGSPIYVSTVYNDPVQLTFDPPVVLSSSDPWQRTYKFCSRYDNGTPDASKVKRYSTSPEPPNPFAPGGPCDIAERQCIGGVNQGTVCGSNPGACFGGGECDACPVRGGVTTKDEMFILLGSYYLP